MIIIIMMMMTMMMIIKDKDSDNDDDDKGSSICEVQELIPGTNSDWGTWPNAGNFSSLICNNSAIP